MGNWQWDPDQIRFPAGPNCADCPFRSTSVAFAPPQGYRYNYDEATATWRLYEPGGLFESARFMFILEALGKDEARQGMNAVGGTGGIFNRLLHKSAGLKRPTVVVTNTVKCRPIKWQACPECAGFRNLFAENNCLTCHNEKQVPMRQDNNDYVNATPSPGQVRECTERYLFSELEAFQGDTIVGCGRTPLSFFAGRPRKISKDLGAIYEPGILLPCDRCKGEGRVSTAQRKDPECKGKGYVLLDEGELSRCPDHPKYQGKIKSRRECAGCKRLHAARRAKCGGCDSLGLIPRPPKRCPACKGDMRVPADPGNPYVSEFLKEGQLYFPTYHPAYIMRQPAQEIILEKLFERIPNIREELALSENVEYHEYPKSDQVEEVCNAKRISVDLETGGLDPDLGDTEVIGITDRPEFALSCMPDDRRVYDMLVRASEGPTPLIIGQNWMQFDAWWLYKKWGLLPPVRCWDTRLAGHLLNPDTPNNMTYLSMEYASPAMRGYWKTLQNYREHLAMVCMLDIDATFRIYNGQHDMLSKRHQVKEYWNEVFPTMRVAFDMRRDGWKVDLDRLGSARVALQEDLDAGRRDLPDWGGVGTENQNEMVHKHLYETLRLPVLTNKDTGNPSAGKEQLRDLKEMIQTEHKRTEHLGTVAAAEAIEFIDLVSFLKERSKLIQFYDPDKMPADGYAHPEWNPAGTATYRFTCTKPNMMNIPKCKCKPVCYGENPKCKNARYPFITEPGWEIMGVDYAQIEVVGFLWTAQQWAVLDKVLNKGLDAHQVMADLLEMERDDAKTNTFSLVYGAEDRTIAANSGKPLHEVQAARVQYMDTFPGVADFRHLFIQQSMMQGYVESAFGRRRYIKCRRTMGRAANQAANAPIQNIPPMIVRRAMVLLHAQLPEPARILANEHDELILTYPVPLRGQVIEAVRDIMGAPVPELAAPQLGMAGGLKLNLDFEVGPDWGHLRPLEDE